jgi:saccharopine dehydrogenase-like NADP-dependent oxidoreductase
MAKHTALLLGCGTIGAAVARLLVADEVFSGVLIADKDVARTHQITTELGEKVTPLEADIHDEATVTCLAQGVSVVLNTIGPFTRHVSAVMRAALHAGVPYADINDEAEISMMKRRCCGRCLRLALLTPRRASAVYPSSWVSDRAQGSRIFGRDTWRTRWTRLPRSASLLL